MFIKRLLGFFIILAFSIGFTTCDDGNTLHTHNWNSWQITTPVTCITAGQQTRVCTDSDCGEIESQEIAILGHDYGSWSVTTPVTCTTAGVQTRICSNNNSHIETRNISATNHNPCTCSATSSDVDQMRQPYYYPGTGEIYNGYISSNGSLTTSGGVTVTYPAETTFSADGFFTLEGIVNNPACYNYAIIEVTKDSDPNNLKTSYFVRGDFKLRIWLRFGSGAYTIRVHGLSDVTDALALNGDGDWVGPFLYWNGSVTFNVTNIRNEGDMRFIYPSYVVQSDAPLVTNLATELTYGLTGENALRAIHDYIVKNTVYDSSSIENYQRKKQDALTVLGTTYRDDTRYLIGHFYAVCEGYANTFAAIARAAGFETRFISSSSMNHAWNQVFVNGSWRLIDVTWDDPVPDQGPNYTRYDYFLLSSLYGVNNSHTGWGVDQGRALIGNTVPWQRGVPDGWY